MSRQDVHVFILSGRSGSGKTTVVNEVTHLLTQLSHDIPHVHIDGDNLDFIHPKDIPDQTPNITLLNLQSLFRNYYTYRRSSSCGLVLISGSAMIQRWREIQDVIEQVCQDVDIECSRLSRIKSYGIILHASDSTVESRLKQRETGTDLERHIESSKRIAGLLDTQFHNPKQHPIHVLHVNTDRKGVPENARLIVKHIIRMVELTTEKEAPTTESRLKTSESEPGPRSPSARKTRHQERTVPSTRVTRGHAMKRRKPREDDLDTELPELMLSNLPSIDEADAEPSKKKRR